MRIQLDITDATQHATAYDEHGRPVASVQRRRVMERGPEWTAYDTSGNRLFVSHTGINLAGRIARILERRERVPFAPLAATRGRGGAFAEVPAPVQHGPAEEAAPVAEERPRRTFRLGSAAWISAPGVVAWGINGYAFKADRDKIRRVIVDGWSIPDSAAHALLSGAAPYTIENETVVFSVGAV